MQKDNNYANTDIEVYHELSKYRNLSQITKKEFFGIVGTTVNGESVLFPDSFQRGFNYELTPWNERPKTEFEIIGIASGTSDGHINYLPSFNSGRELGKELKFYVLAQKMSEIVQENQGLKSKVNELKSKLEEFIKKPRF